MLNYIILSGSLILENCLSLVFYESSTLFLPLFSLISLFIIYPQFKDQKFKYLVISFLFGLLYDIVFINYIGLNALIFLFIAYIISKICDNFQPSLFNNIIITILLIVIYRLLNYFYLVIILNIQFDVIMLLKSIYSSLILNIIYIIIFYFLSSKKIIKFVH